jgi:two-component system OmpR family response regulator
VDIAVVDIMMTGMDGFELCQLLKDRYQLPVIMLTARDALSYFNACSPLECVTVFI